MKCRFTGAVVNAVIILTVWLLIPMGLHAETWQDVSASTFTNTEIVWQVPSNALPKTLWVYHRLLPHVFAASVISNAVVLGSLEKRGFPKPSTNDFFISQEVPPDWPAPVPTLLGIVPKDAYLYYSVASYAPLSPQDIPNDKAIMSLARQDAPRLNLTPAELTQSRIYTHWSDTDASRSVCGRGVFFPRQLDGISFFSADDNGDGAEGFSIEFGGHGKVQAFSVRWSEVEHYKNERTASLDEITRCIRAHKTIVMPNFQPDDFIQLRNLAATKKLTITKVTPYYGEGLFGDVPTNDVPYGFATPFAKLDAVADFGTSNVTVRLLSPIIASEANRLLSGK